MSFDKNLDLVLKILILLSKKSYISIIGREVPKKNTLFKKQ